MTNGDVAKSNAETRDEILVINLKEALRVGERYLFIALAMSAVAVASLDGEPKTFNLSIVTLPVQGNYVWLASFAISWCAAWLSWSHIRHAAALAGMQGVGRPHLSVIYGVPLDIWLGSRRMLVQSFSGRGRGGDARPGRSSFNNLLFGNA
jgi:hypothetical protein